MLQLIYTQENVRTTTTSIQRQKVTTKPPCCKIITFGTFLHIFLQTAHVATVNFFDIFICSAEKETFSAIK